MVVDVGVTVKTGMVLTVTVAVLGRLMQPPLDPVSVYTVVEEGLTTLVVPEPDGNQV